MSQDAKRHQCFFGTIPHTCIRPGSPVAHSFASDAPAYGECSSADNRRAASLLQKIPKRSFCWLKGCFLCASQDARGLYI